MRFAAPPVAGSVQMLPCKSIASVRPSGETATDIDVPSETVTSIGGRAGAASSATRPIVASSAPVRIMLPPRRRILLFPPGSLPRRGAKEREFEKSIRFFGCDGGGDRRHVRTGSGDGGRAGRARRDGVRRVAVRRQSAG